MIVKADFHIHSCLSPCGSLEMSPRSIVERATARGLNLVAISDHNSALNCPTLAKICAAEKMHCFFGIEVSTIEEVHCLCLFDRLDKVLELDEIVYSHLPDIKNVPEKFGDQVVVNEHDEIIKTVDKFLGSSVLISMSELNQKVHALGGLFIPSHINRSIFSLITQLGFVPLAEPFDAVEIYHASFLQGRPKIPDISYPMVSNSDAHYLDQIGKIWNEFDLQEITLAAVAQAIAERKNQIKY